MRKMLLMVMVLAWGFAAHALAAVQEEVVEYSDGDVRLKGYLYWDDAVKEKRPGVMVVHEWWGLNDYAKRRARMLAELGYVGFAADMYGDNRVTEHAAEAGAWMKQITANIDAWQKRAMLGLERLRGDKRVDAANIAAIGYCFGGATVMQMAYAGAPVKGVVSFHGALPPATEAQLPNIKARVLAFHGYDDAMVPKERVAQFEAMLDKAGADWQMVVYGGTRHSFTNPDAGKFGIENLAYNPAADRRSWAGLKTFLAELFSR